MTTDKEKEILISLFPNPKEKKKLRRKLNTKGGEGEGQGKEREKDTWCMDKQTSPPPHRVLCGEESMELGMRRRTGWTGMEASSLVDER